MRPNLKRLWSGVAAVAVVATTATLVNTPAAHAAGTLVGPATVKTAGGGADLNSGTSATNFTLRLPASAACPGDSAGANWRWQTYMVPGSVDPATLTFPLTFATGAALRSPLFDTGGSPVSDRLTDLAATPGGPGVIINIPDVNYSVFGPGDIPAGAYNIGIACTLGPASGTQMSSFWNVTKTFTTNTGSDPAQVDWSVGAVPAAPVLNTVTPGDGQLTAAFTPGASTPAATGYTATATPSSGPAITATGAGFPIVIPGLTNGTSYSVTVSATNTVGNSAQSNAISGTPTAAARPPVTGLTATPGIGQVILNWTAPTGTAPTGYEISYTVPSGASAGTPTSPFTVTAPATTSGAITGLSAGYTYSFTVTPQHPSPFVGLPASVDGTPNSAQTTIQDVTVVRPAGALILRQVCGRTGGFAAETASFGFPSGVPLVPAAAGTGGLVATNCAINLGTAQLVGTGGGAGQFYSASGYVNQLNVADTRDTDIGWSATGIMSTFVNTANAAKTFSGNQLGWKPVVASTTPTYTDGNGNPYTQVVTAGPERAQTSATTPAGLGTSKTLASAAAGTGLGVSELDARVKVLIPVSAPAGTYTGTLTFSLT